MPQYPASIDLQTLSGTTGYTFRSATAGDWLGYSIRIVGDANGDFVPDLLIGAPGEDPIPTAAVSHTLAGRAFLVFGGVANLASLDAADGTVDNVINPANLNGGGTGYVLQGVSLGDEAGVAVSGAQNIDGLAGDDFLVGSPAFSGSASHGVVALVSGGAANLSALDAADGLADGSIQLSNVASGGYDISGPDPGDHAGFSLSSLGDVNGDGIADILVGANFADPSSHNAAGEAYVVFGGGSNLTALDAADGSTDHHSSLANLSTATGYVLFGNAIGDNAGIAVAGIQDINGDGIADLMVGAWMTDPGGQANAGSAYIVFGGSANLAALDTAGGSLSDGRINLTGVNGATGYTLDGLVVQDRLGLGLASADLNGDGISDVILGAYLADPQAPAGANGGEAYIVFGGTTNLANLDASDGATDGHLSPAQLTGGFGYRVVSANAVDWLGYSISAAGDVNGDGFDDVIIGANYGDSGGNRSGDSFIVFGGLANLAAWDVADGTTDGKLDVDFLNGTTGFRLQGVDASDQSGVSVSDAGDMNGDGLTDLLVGAPRANSLAGEAYVVFGRLPDAAVNRTGTGIAQNLVGGDFNDTLSGLGGDDILYGHGGDDVLKGGTGDDTFIGGLGTDTADFTSAVGPITVDLSNGAAQNTGEGNDRFLSIENIIGSGFADHLTGDGLANTLGGGGENDTLIGGAGDDVLAGGAGNDLLDGGADIDTADYSSAGAGVTVNLLLTGQQNTTGAGTDTLMNIENLTGSGSGDTLIGSTGDNVLSGGNGEDDLQGRGGNDTLFGGIGIDRLNGGAGIDVMTGGTGNDTYIVDNAADQVHESAGGGIDKVNTSVSYTLQAGTEVEYLMAVTGASGLVLTGNELNNRIVGREGADTLDGNGGADMLLGGAGNDTYVVHDAAVRIFEAADSGTDTVMSSVTLKLSVNVENLTLTGISDIDGTGNNLDNTITGNGGVNKLVGGLGVDTLIGGDGDDKYFVDNAADVVIEGATGDIDMVFSKVDYTLAAGSEVEHLHADAGATGLHLTGNEFKNNIYGLSGADTITGAGGSDLLMGGGGDDFFVYRDISDSLAGSGRDHILDFQVNHDRIDLSAIDANANTAIDDAFNFVGTAAFSHTAGEVRQFTSNGNTIVAGDVTGDGVADFQIQIQGLMSLSLNDFVL